MPSRRITIELVAIRAVLELPESTSPEASERADEFTADVLRAFRPLAKCPALPAPRKAASR
jgi:hypothetical protein